MYVREKLLSGGNAIGTLMRVIKNPSIAYFAKNNGVDFMLFDCEHSDYSMESLHGIFMMCSALGIEGFLRVPRGTSDYISRALDAGATGVMVPMTETAEQAAEIVKWSRYPKLGVRGFTSSNAHTGYKGLGHMEVIDGGNDRVVTIAQIETGLGVQNAEEIAAVEGIDVLLVGHNDLSVSLGVPGKIHGEEVLGSIRKVIAAAKKHGKVFGLCADPAYLSNFKEDISLMMVGSDVAFLNAAFKSIRDTFDTLKK